MRKYLPEYITNKKNIVRLLLFVAFFALMFVVINCYFSLSDWFSPNDKIDKFVLYSILVVLIGIAILIISRLIMYFLSLKYKISLLVYFGWIFAEVSIIAFAISFFVSSVSDHKTDFFNIYPRFFIIVSATLFAPYIISWMYPSMRNMSKEKENGKNHFSFHHLLKRNNYFEKMSEPVSDVMLINFKDEKGELRLSVHSDFLYYIESADNYVKIFYSDKGKLTSYLLRNSLKNMELLLKDELMMRCHRSYMVNVQKIKVLRKTREGLFIELGDNNVPDIPVSKTYSKKILKLFSES